jgi:DNA-binding transcriptional LysR family regulator
MGILRCRGRNSYANRQRLRMRGGNIECRLRDPRCLEKINEWSCCGALPIAGLTNVGVEVRTVRRKRSQAEVPLIKRMRHFDFWTLSHLEAAVNAGSVRGGATLLNTSASALSRRIKSIEEELGIPLLERHGRGVRATEAGMLFLQYFRKQAADIEAVVHGVWEILGLQRGAVSIALGEGFGAVLMPVLNKFAKVHPQVQVNLAFCSADEIAEKILSDDVHIGISYNLRRDPRLHVHAKSRHRMCAVVAPDHPLAMSGRQAKIKDLSSYELGLLPGHYGARQVLSRIEDEEHVILSPKLTSNSLSSLQLFAAECGGVIVTAEFTVRSQILAGSLVVVELEDAEMLAGEVQLLTRRGRRLPPAATTLLSEIKNTLAVL